MKNPRRVVSLSGCICYVKDEKEYKSFIRWQIGAAICAVVVNVIMFLMII